MKYMIPNRFDKQLPYLEKTKAVLQKIEGFATYFNDNNCAEVYKSAWEKNKKHGIALNCLKPESALYIYNIIKHTNPAVILEIGTGGAYSTLIIADALLQLGHNGHIHTIEKSAPKIEIVKIHIRESDQKNITLIEGDAKDIIPQLQIPDGKKIDMLFLDADRKQYKSFLIACEPLFGSKTIVIADNINSHPEDVRDFVSYIKESGKYISEIIPIGSGLLVATII